MGLNVLSAEEPDRPGAWVTVGLIIRPSADGYIVGRVQAFITTPNAVTRPSFPPIRDDGRGTVSLN